MGFKPLAILGRNRFELYISLAIVFLGVLYSVPVRPQSFSHVMVLTGSLIIGLTCAVNAVRDYERMYWVERVFAMTWLIILIVATAWAVWDLVTIETFSPR